METTINRNLLRFAVSTAMFCPLCQTCLDTPKAVQFDVDAPATGAIPARTISKVVCTGCFDKTIQPLIASIQATLPASTATVLDGRVLFPSRKGRKGAR